MDGAIDLVSGALSGLLRAPLRSAAAVENHLYFKSRAFRIERRQGLRKFAFAKRRGQKKIEKSIGPVEHCDVADDAGRPRVYPIEEAACDLLVAIESGAHDIKLQALVHRRSRRLEAFRG